MRIPSLAALLTLAAMPAAAQGILIPLAPSPAAPPPSVEMDSVRVWGTLRDGRASIYVEHVFRNGADAAVDGIFVFPLPADARVSTVAVFQGTDLVRYDVWSGGATARSRVDSLARARPDAGLAEYAGRDVVHVPVGFVGPGESRRVQITYVQPLRRENRTLGFRYPLSVGAEAAPIGHVTLRLEVRTMSGFADLRSPSHQVQVLPGTEAGRCDPRERCGFTNVPSRRVRVVTLVPGEEDRARDFEFLYAPADPAEAAPVVVLP